MRILDESLASRPQNLFSLVGQTRRIGVPEVSYREILGTSPSLPRGKAIPKVREQIWRYLAGKLAFRAPQPQGTIFMRSWADVDYAVKVLLQYVTEIEAAALPNGIIENEVDNAQKAVLESGQSGDGHIDPEGLSNDADIGLPGVKELFDWIDSTVGPLPTDVNMTVVKGTNHGWPSYEPGKSGLSDVDLFAHIWLAGRLAIDKGDFHATADWFNREVFKPSIPVSATMFFRTGPSKKEVFSYRLTDAGPQAFCASVGLFTRARQVFAVPAFINLYLRFVATRIKYMLRKSDHFYHRTKTETFDFINKYPGWEWYSEDISGYDRSVTRRMQKDLLKDGYSRYMSEGEQTCYDQLNDLGVLAPPLALGQEAFIYDRSGMTISGSILTTIDGTLINAARIGYAVCKAKGLQPWEMYKVWSEVGKSWTFKVLGDDCIIGYDPKIKFSKTQYLAGSRELGFKSEFFPGPVFLMTSYDLEDNRSFGVLSRAISKTYFREHASAGVHVDLLGLYYRWERCQEHPLFQWAWDNAVASHPAALQYGIGTLENLRRTIETPTFIQGFENEVTRNAAMRMDLRMLLTGIGHGDLDETSLAWLPPKLLLGIAPVMNDLEMRLGITRSHDLLIDFHRKYQNLWIDYFRRLHGPKRPTVDEFIDDYTRAEINF
jgi:hypothetical protein